MTGMNDIEVLTDDYADERAALVEAVARLQAELDAAKRAHLPQIRRAVGRAAQARDRLHAEIDAHRDLFAKPRTRILCGVKVGLQKQKGKVQIDDEGAAVGRIRAQLPAEQADLLIRTRESVDKTAVVDLTAGDLKRLGIRISDDTDVVVIKPADSEVDKLVDALLGEAGDAGEEAA